VRKKVCTKCKESKYLRNFPRRSDNGKHSSWCKNCFKKTIAKTNKRRTLSYTRAVEDRMFFGGNRALALERDNYRCVKCNMSNEEHLLRWGRTITVDHIRGRVDDSLANLQTLCLLCHGHKDILRRKDFIIKEELNLCRY